MLKNVKKLFCLMLSMALLFAFGGTAMAASLGSASEPKDRKIIFKAEEIKDVNKLLDRAQKGESDLPVDKIKSESKLVNAKTKEAYKVDTYKTAQLLEVTTDGQTVEKTYAVTVIDVMNLPDATTTSSGTGSENGIPTWDDSISVKAYSTIYYSYTDDAAGNRYYKMTKGSGGWTISDSTVSLSRRSVYLAQMGANRSDGIFATYEMPMYYPTSNSFSYSTSSSWPYVLLIPGSALRLDSHVLLTRGSTNWYLDHQQLYT